MPFVRAYLRASTDDQDASRARGPLERFVAEQGAKVASWYVENESGATLQRPELFRLIGESHPGDVLLIEQVDRLSRLTDADWQKLRAALKRQGVRVVALDLPTSHKAMPRGDSPKQSEPDFTDRMLDAVNDMLLDMLAAVARKDYEDRRRRQVQGIAKAKSAGLYRGRQANESRHARIGELLDAGMSWSKVQDLTQASRSTILRVVNARKHASALSAAE